MSKVSTLSASIAARVATKETYLKSRGFIIGPTPENLKKFITAPFVVAESHDAGEEPVEDFYCIHGPNLAELIEEAYDNFA